MIVELCKFLAIQAAQRKKDNREIAIAKDYIRTGKNHKAFFKRGRGTKVIQLPESEYETLIEPTD